MPVYKMIAKYMGYAECEVIATNKQDAIMKAQNAWPDEPWQAKFGGVDFKTPDGAHFISIECAEIAEDP